MKHGVHFYEVDTFLLDSVADFAKEGLERQETVIIVATEQHRGDLKTKLTEDLVGLWAPTPRNYVTLDASTTLRLFMRNGWPDEGLFLKVIGQIIQSAGRGKPVRIYGEMVAVLWAEGNTLAAIHLERLWNKLASQQDFTLLCGVFCFRVSRARDGLCLRGCMFLSFSNKRGESVGSNLSPTFAISDRRFPTLGLAEEKESTYW